MDYLQIRDAYNSLSHSGIKGMKWGVRKYTNYDGSLNYSGQKRYQIDSNGSMSEKGKEKYTKDLITQKGNDAVNVSKTVGKFAGAGLGALAGLGIGGVVSAGSAIKNKKFGSLSLEDKRKNLARKAIGGAIIGAILGSTVGKIVGVHNGNKFGKTIKKQEKDYHTKL